MSRLAAEGNSRDSVWQVLERVAQLAGQTRQGLRPHRWDAATGYLCGHRQGQGRRSVSIRLPTQLTCRSTSDWCDTARCSDEPHRRDAPAFPRLGWPASSPGRFPHSGILVSGDDPGSTTMTPARDHPFSGSDSSSRVRCSCSRMMRALWDPTPAIWLSSLVLAATMLRSVPK